MTIERNSATRRRSLTALALMSAAALAMSACSSSGGGAGAASGSAPGVLKWATTLPSHWDPVVNGAGAQFRPLALVYSALTSTDAKGNPTPALAKSWKYNAAGTEVTFHLRPGLKFSDGTPVNAQAVAEGILRGKTQKNSAQIEDLGPIKDVKASGDLDVQVFLDHPDYQIPLVLGERVSLIASPKAAADPTKLDQAPVGAGPFVVSKLVPGQEAILKKNPTYWDAKDIHIDEVDLLPTPDPSTLIAGFSSGTYNFASLPPAQLSAAKAAGLDTFTVPEDSAQNISINLNKAPFKGNPDLVTAFRYAIDRDQFVKQITFGQGSATDQVFPKGILGHDPKSENLFPYDPAKAKEYLAKAVKAGFDPSQAIQLVDSTADPELEIIQSQLKAIGVKVEIKVDPNWATGFFGKQYALSVYGTTGRDSSTETLRAHFGPNGVLNLSTPYEPAGFEAAVDKAEATPIGSPDYEKNLIAANRIGNTSQALIFTFSEPNLFVKSPSVSDFVNEGPAHTDLTGVTVK